jgi:hypothetical protein
MVENPLAARGACPVEALTLAELGGALELLFANIDFMAADYLYWGPFSGFSEG